MVKATKRPTKRKSKRLRDKSRLLKDAQPKVPPSVPVRKSKRITASLLSLKKINVGSAPDLCQEIVNDDEPRPRPVRLKQIDLPTFLHCADLKRETMKRLGLKSCFCCDNFRTDRVFMSPGTTADLNLKKYGCRRQNELKVSVKYSRHHNQESLFSIKASSESSAAFGTVPRRHDSFRRRRTFEHEILET